MSKKKKMNQAHLKNQLQILKIVISLKKKYKMKKNQILKNSK